MAEPSGPDRLHALADSTRALYIDVPGHPVPQGSKVKGKHGGIYESAAKELKPWREAITVHTQAAIRAQFGTFYVLFPKDHPVSVKITFLMPRPAGHYSRAATQPRLLLPAAPRKPAARPDIDKLTRAVLDALKTGRAYTDDGQVTDLAVRKRYATGAMLPGGGAHIEITGA
jgi:Holliday junction resolvase RusA-like endonuclease